MNSAVKKEKTKGEVVYKVRRNMSQTIVHWFAFFWANLGYIGDDILFHRSWVTVRGICQGYEAIWRGDVR